MNYIPRTVSSKILVCTLLAMIAFSAAMEIYQYEGRQSQINRPKKGCRWYGHVCYGGHGKRAELDADKPDESPIAIQRQGDILFNARDDAVPEVLRKDEGQFDPFVLSSLFRQQKLKEMEDKNLFRSFLKTLQLSNRVVDE